MTIQHHFSVLIHTNTSLYSHTNSHTNVYGGFINAKYSIPSQVGDEETTVIDTAIQWKRKILRSETELVLHPTRMTSEPQRCTCCMMPLTWFDRTDQQLLSGMIQLGEAGWDTVYGLHLLVTIVFKKGITCYLYYTLGMERKVGAYFSHKRSLPDKLMVLPKASSSLRKEPFGWASLSPVLPLVSPFTWLPRHLIYLFPSSH